MKSADKQCCGAASFLCGSGSGKKNLSNSGFCSFPLAYTYTVKCQFQPFIHFDAAPAPAPQDFE
jgi:hypothetical protein